VLLEHWQAQGIKHLAGKPLTVFDYAHSKEIFPHAQPEPSLVQLGATPVCPAISDQGAETSTFLCAAPKGNCNEKFEMYGKRL